MKCADICMSDMILCWPIKIIDDRRYILSDKKNRINMLVSGCAVHISDFATNNGYAYFDVGSVRRLQSLTVASAVSSMKEHVR